MGELIGEIVVGFLSMAWGRWQCEVVAPDGHRERVTLSSLHDARARAALLSDAIQRDGSVGELLA